MLKTKKKFNGKLKTRIMTGVFGLMSVVLVGSVLVNAFATASDYYYDSANVSLNGVDGGTAYMYLRTAGGGTFYSMQGDFSINETNDDNGYMSLSSLMAAGENGSTSIVNFDADGFRRLLHTDSNYDGNTINANNPIMIAVYSVDKDTPAGDYTVSVSNVSVVGGTSGFDGEHLPNMVGTIHVTRNDEPMGKPSQVVVFRDGENEITEITKHYGDADFTITKEVTVGDGEMEYHPDDDGSGSVAHTVPGGDTVGVGVPGDVQICAWMSETENYAATKACYTVHVLPRPLDITGAVIENKTYDGTTSATVTSVSFEDRSLNPEDYTATATFEEPDAGENVKAHVSVELTGSAAVNYVLNASNYNTTGTILPYHLIRERVELLESGTYGYEPGGVEPEVMVTAPGVFGGTYTLVEGQDYEVAYSNNTNVTNNAHVTVTGKGNFTTGEVPVVIDFTIEARGINNDNLIAPSSIVEGHVLTPDEIGINVDGHDLIQCASTEDTNCDYTIEIQGENDGVIGHSIHVAVNARGNYTGVAVADIEVVAKLSQTVSFGDVTNTTIDKKYGDSDIKYEATSDGDGTISYASSNEAVATVSDDGTVTIVGVGEADIIATASETDTYAQGSAKYTVAVAKGEITVSSASIANKTYDGTTAATVNDVSLSVAKGSLVFNTDFTATATFNNANVGDRIVTVNITLNSGAFANYCFVINSTDCVDTAAYLTDGNIAAFTLGADNSTVVLSNTVFEYNGEAKEPTATLSVDLDGDSTKETTLTAETDYTIEYDNNTNAGTATATIVGQGNYVGELSGIQFTISRALASDVNVTAPSQTYNGEALTPVPTVTGTVNGEDVTFTTDDYEIAEHDDFINAGNHTFTIVSKDGSNYNIPSINGTFVITRAASGVPAESSTELKIESGKTLAELGERTNGFSWVDADATVALGSNEYSATYTKNNDTLNYTTVDLTIPVYGLKRIGITTVEMDGGSVTGPGASALEGDELTFTIVPDENYEFRMVMVNDEDLTGEVSNNKLVLTAGTEDLMVIVYYRRTYEVVEGAGQKHIRSVDGTATFEIDADFELFEDGGKVYVDGNLVASENYEAWSSSTVIKFSADYMDSLGSGEHTLAVLFNDGGIARATFIIEDPEEESPEAADTGVFTGVNGGVVATGLSSIVITSVIGLAYIVRRKNS